MPRLGVHPWWVRPNGCLGRALPELQAGQEQGGPPGFPDPVRLSGVVPSQAHLGSADAPHPRALHTAGPLPLAVIPLSLLPGLIWSYILMP